MHEVAAAPKRQAHQTIAYAISEQRNSRCRCQVPAVLCLVGVQQRLHEYPSSYSMLQA